MLKRQVTKSHPAANMGEFELNSSEKSETVTAAHEPLAKIEITAYEHELLWGKAPSDVGRESISTDMG